MRKHGLFTALVALALVSCGGEGAFQQGTAGGAGAQVASITLITSSPTLPSDGALPSEITAFVRNASNQFMKDVPVTFSANSGGILVTQGSTDVNGVAKANLTPAGDPTTRSITVTALAGSISSTVTVGVTGSQLAVQGPNALTLNQVGNYRVTLLDAANRAIAARTITLTSARSNTLSASTVTTDSTGSATFTLTAVNGGNETITATGLGLTATAAISVNSDSFTVTAPAAGTEIALSAAQTITVRWLVNNAPVVGQPVTFATTRGTIGTATVNTDSQGNASTTVSATDAGGAIVTATTSSNSASIPLEFVALTPATVNIQPSVFSVGPNQTSTLTAVVRDTAGNLVKNKTVVFTLTDVTGGTLSVGSAVTNSQGRAQTVYTASNTTSANQGVVVAASVQGFPAVTPNQVGLTVARRELFISIGTGNEIAEPNPAQYRLDYIVQVTDSNGNGVAGVPVSLRILSVRYYKGFRVAPASGSSMWGTTYMASCVDEDTHHNGILDPIYDYNHNSHLEAGNIATVTPSNGVTDANGFINVQVYYPQEHADYLDVDLSASATVSGTEYVRISSFNLPHAAADFNNPTIIPPGYTSPFGVANTCSDEN